MHEYSNYTHRLGPRLRLGVLKIDTRFGKVLTDGGFLALHLKATRPGVSWILTHSSQTHRAAADHLPELDSYLINDNSCQFPTMSWPSSSPVSAGEKRKYTAGGVL